MGDDFFYDLGFILMMDEIEKEKKSDGEEDEEEGEVFVAEDEEY
ncbi:MAG: hypothetical protein ACXV3F_02375 [Frankiaceae bacterium]